MVVHKSPLAILFLLSFLHACGGGGGGSSTPNASTPSLSSSSQVSIANSSISSESSAVSESSAPSSAASSITPSEDNLYSLASFPIGMAVLAGNEDRSFLTIDAKQTTIKQHFNQLTPGNIMKMSYLHPTEDTYSYEHADALVNWAKSNGISVHGHTFIWHSDYQIPAWMKTYTGDFATMLDNHVTEIATHFADDVVSWDVVNEVIDESQTDCYRKSLFFEKLNTSFIENAFIAARKADPDADLYYNDFDTDGGNADKLTCLLQMVDNLQTKQVPIDGVGFQMHIQIDWPSIASIKAAFQAIVDRGLKVKITELDIPVNNPYNTATFPQFATYSENAQTQHKARYRDVVQAYIDTVPADKRGGITIWGLWDGDSWLHDFDNRKDTDDWPLLFSGPSDGPYATKASFDGVVEALLNQ